MKTLTVAAEDLIELVVWSEFRDALNITVARSLDHRNEFIARAFFTGSDYYRFDIRPKSPTGARVHCTFIGIDLNAQNAISDTDAAARLLEATLNNLLRRKSE